MFSALMNVNFSIFQEINAPAGTYPWLDAFMVFGANWLIFLFPLVLVMAWGRPVNWRKPTGPQDEELLQERRASVIWVGIACLVAYGINLLIEQFVFEPRPFVSHRVHLLVTHVADSSFPSDHTAWGFAVVGMLLFQFFPMLPRTYQHYKEARIWSIWRPFFVPGLLLVLAIILASTIGIARIFVGLHYPGDILGGAIDGLVAALLVTLLRRKLSQPTSAVIRFAHRLRIA